MIDKSLQSFANEAETLLHTAEKALLTLDYIGNEKEMEEYISDLFGVFTIIKGAAGLYGLAAIVGFTHIVEDFLGQIREGNIAVTEAMVTLFLSCMDHLEQLVVAALAGQVELDEALKRQDN